MRLTVLGASPACQNPGGACSGYLLEQDGVAVLIDCGSGVFARLQQYLAPESVQAIVISHMHADHTLDLLPYHYYLYFSHAEGRAPGAPALYLPPGGHERLLSVSRMQEQSPDFFAGTFGVDEYDPQRALQVGPFTIDFSAVQHIPHTYALRVHGAAEFSFSADTGPCEGLLQAARGSDVFLCECANVEGSDYPFHLTPRQAGSAAREAGVGRLVLTHRWWVYGQEATLAEAREQYAGPVDLAREGMRITIAP